MSLGTPGAFASSSSGETCSMDAVRLEVPVSGPPFSRAMPKSPSLGSPYALTRTFSGLMSRCRMPAWCAVSSAPQTLTMISSTSAHGSVVSDSRRSASDPWSMKSIRM